MEELVFSSLGIITAFTAATILGWFTGWFDVAPWRLLQSGTKLGVFDAPIGGVATELMYRSVKLRTNFTEFRTCVVQNSCDYKRLLSDRDKIIASEWPQVYDRLVVEHDWSWWYIAQRSRQNFLSEQKTYGSDALRNACVPELRYWYDNGYAPDFNFVQFRCPPRT